jgi:hypothetical protein
LVSLYAFLVVVVKRVAPAQAEVEEEVNALQAEQDMPIEELLKKLGCA